MRDAAPVDSFRERAIREAPEGMAAAVARCLELIDQWHAEPVTPRIPKPLFYPKDATAVDRICLTCRGYGFTQEDHGYDHAVGIVGCRRCGGKGFLA